MQHWVMIMVFGSKCYNGQSTGKHYVAWDRITVNEQRRWGLPFPDRVSFIPCLGMSAKEVMPINKRQGLKIQKRMKISPR